MSGRGALGTVVRLAGAFAITGWLADRLLQVQDRGAGPAAIRTVVTIDAPIEDVWAILADIERQPEWMHDLKEVRLTTPPPIGAGTRGVGRVRAFGISVTDPVVVTAFEPPTHFGIRHDGMVSGTGDIRLESNAGAVTVVTWDETLHTRLLPHLGSRVLATVFRPIFVADLHRLALLVEASGEATGGPP